MKWNRVTVANGHKIQWSNETRYLGVYLISSEIFSISLDNAKKSFYRAFNALFSKGWRVAYKDVVVELLKNQMFSDIAVWYGSMSAYKDTNKFAKLCHL